MRTSTKGRSQRPFVAEEKALLLTIRSESFDLRGHLSRPDASVDENATGGSSSPSRPGLILAHGFPHGPGGAKTSGGTYPELADHLSAESGWPVLTFNFRGTGESEGNFSLGGWVADVRAAIDYFLGTGEVDQVWLAGSSAGGAVSICAAAEDERAQGVATLAAPADFHDWSQDPDTFLEQAREIGVIRDAGFPTDLEAWRRELREVSPILAVAKIAPRPVLILHGTNDDVVAVHDARVLADATHDHAELRILADADHRLRLDPRAIAILLGWMDRCHTDA